MTNNMILKFLKKVLQRHRLVGLDNDAIVAELWCHTDLNNPSDEDDIVRVSDIYSRI